MLWLDCQTESGPRNPLLCAHRPQGRSDPTYGYGKTFAVHTIRSPPAATM